MSNHPFSWMCLLGLICSWAGPSLAAAPKAAAIAARPPAASFTPMSQPTHWDAVGWGGGGFFWCCAFDPVKPDVVYLGGDVAGLYKSEDQGRHWRFINRGLANYAVYSMAISPSDPQTLYVLTNGGICKTIDGGEHWEFLESTGRKQQNITSKRPMSVRPLAIAPDDPRLVYAGSGQGSLYKTEDGGKTWQRIGYLQAAGGQRVSLAPSTPACSGKGFLVLDFESDQAEPNKHGRVEKGFALPGVDWSAQRKVTARFFVPPDAPPLEGQLVVQSGPKWLWQPGASIAGKPGQWAEVSLDLEGLKDLQTVHFLYFVVRSPVRGYHGEIFLDAVSLHSKSNADVTLLGDWEKPGDTEGWRANTKVADGLLVVDAHQSAQTEAPDRGAVASVVTAGAKGKLVFVCNPDVGLFRSADAGQTWIHLKSPRGATSAAIVSADTKIVYAAFDAAGLYRSADQGDTWTAAGPILPPKTEIREVAIDPQNRQVICCIANAGWKGYFCRSEDGGQTWTTATLLARDLEGNPTLPEETGGGTLPPGTARISKLSNLAIHPRRPQHVFLAGNWHNCLSTDGGRTWSERIRGADISCVQDIQFYDGKAYVAAMDEGLMASDDHGTSWRQLCPRKYAAGISGHQWRVRVWKQGERTRILSTVSPWGAGDEYPNGVLISDDGGAHFTKSTQGLPNYVSRVHCLWGQSYARSLAAHPQDPDTLYLGMDGDPEPAKGRTGGGVFRSRDGGRTWQPLAAQPACRGVFFGLAVDPTDRQRLFFGACGANGGLYRSEDAGESWKRVLSSESWVFNMTVADHGTVYCAGRNLHVSTDHGNTWKRVTHFTEPEPIIVGIALDPQDENRMWISRVTWGETARGGVYRTIDGGRTWQEITGDLAYCKPLVLRYDPERSELWAGGVGLFKTPQPKSAK